MSARARAGCVTIVVTLVPLSAGAQGSDPAAAREHLKHGYTLRQEGRCAEAVPHFVESIRLDPAAKTLLNLVECERELGRLSDALKHAADARDRATEESQSALRAIADEQITSIEARMPRLTITLVGGGARTTVHRDGVVLGEASLGLALPLDPGTHVVVVREQGRQEKIYEVMLVEGETRALIIEPGAPSAGPAASPAAPAGRGDEPSRTPIAAYALGGVGVVLLGAGTYFGLRTFDLWSDAKDACGTGCAPDSPARDLKEDADTHATIATVAFIGGSVALAAAVVLWLARDRDMHSAQPAQTKSRRWTLSAEGAAVAF